MAEKETTNVVCPKCGSAALGATKSTIPTSQIYKVNVRVRCLHCGAEFSLVEK
jgi:DNA-directed RNA polymerase subunit RPC12/RpoP